MPTVDEALEKLQACARPDQVAGMARYGMSADRRLGVSVPDMRRIGKELGKDHGLALALWQTRIPEAMILAALVDRPQALTGEQMDAWVAGLNSWDICDQVCMNLFEKSPLAWEKIREWSGRPEEFVRRAAYALLACLAWHDKQADDAAFIALLPVIVAGAGDGRGMVKKAVSWALRHIGKRNARLHAAALETAHEIQATKSPSARWIAADALRDLASDTTRRRLRLT